MTAEQIGQTTPEKEVAMGEEIKAGKKAVNELEATINPEATTESQATSIMEVLGATNTQNVKEKSNDGISYLLISCLPFHHLNHLKKEAAI